MNYITLTKGNISTEHICCAVSGDDGAKKLWLTERMEEGLVFCKGDVRGKCFIEYIPAEYAWVPIVADGYMYINCFWVSGQFKGKGYANQLLDGCIADSRAKGKRGVCAISSERKKPFLSDPGYLRHKGFLTADAAEPFFTLMYLSFDGTVPSFRPCAKSPHTDGSGFEMYYTYGCPYTAKYIPLLEAVAKEHNIPLKTVLLDSRRKAQNAPAAWTNFALFYDGEYVTNQIPSENAFIKLAAERS